MLQESEATCLLQFKMVLHSFHLVSVGLQQFPHEASQDQHQVPIETNLKFPSSWNFTFVRCGFYWNVPQRSKMAICQKSRVVAKNLYYYINIVILLLLCITGVKKQVKIKFYFTPVQMHLWTVTFNLLHFQKQNYTFAITRFPRQTTFFFFQHLRKKPSIIYSLIFSHPITHLMVMEMGL